MSCTWLTIQEAADFLKVDRTTIYSYIKKGDLAVCNPTGRLVRICLEELNIWMRGEKVQDVLP